jgi:hypothetical protein
MKPPFETHNVSLLIAAPHLAYLSRKFKCAFICFGAGIGEEAFFEWVVWFAGFYRVDDEFGEISGPERVVEI